MLVQYTNIIRGARSTKLKIRRADLDSTLWKVCRHNGYLTECKEGDLYLQCGSMKQWRRI